MTSTKQGVKSGNSGKDKNGFIQKLRPFWLPMLFAIGGVGGYFINDNDLMTKVGTLENVAPSNIALVQCLVYLGVIFLVGLGFVFQMKINKIELKRNEKNK
jgi:hypothetical protein